MARVANLGEEVSLCLLAISKFPIIHDTKISSFEISSTDIKKS
jgi:hypothetical protein